MFSLELKMQRESHGLSQAQLAQQLGVSQATVGMWESGKRDPSFTTLQAICTYFGISADQFLGLDNAPVSASTDTDTELLRKYHALDERGQQLIQTLLEHEYEQAQKEEASITSPA